MFVRVILLSKSAPRGRLSFGYGDVSDDHWRRKCGLRDVFVCKKGTDQDEHCSYIKPHAPLPDYMLREMNLGSPAQSINS